MLHRPQPLDDRERLVLAEVESLRSSLSRYLREPRRWTGSLRRLSLARNIQGSNSIEGFTAVLDDAAAVIEREEPLDADEETTRALAGYREAMTFVLQTAQDEPFELSEQVIQSLHFMMTSYSLDNRPGRWRTGQIFVRREVDGQIVYEGPDADDVPLLMNELVGSMAPASEHPIITAAMAHLNLVMIHPFKDGNGRMARCLQSFVLARGGFGDATFMSIEEYLGRNAEAYYRVLADIGSGEWSPSHDPQPWIRFALTAHLRQAHTTSRRFKEAERLWLRFDELTRAHRLPERTMPALFDAALGLRVRRNTYLAALRASGEPAISEQTATNDLKRLTDAGLLVPHGERRGRHYRAGEAIAEAAAAVRANRKARDDADPFDPAVPFKPQRERLF